MTGVIGVKISIQTSEQCRAILVFIWYAPGATILLLLILYGSRTNATLNSENVASRTKENCFQTAKGIIYGLLNSVHAWIGRGVMEKDALLRCLRRGKKNGGKKINAPLECRPILCVFAVVKPCSGMSFLCQPYTEKNTLFLPRKSNTCVKLQITGHFRTQVTQITRSFLFFLHLFRVKCVSDKGLSKIHFEHKNFCGYVVEGLCTSITH